MTWPLWTYGAVGGSFITCLQIVELQRLPRPRRPETFGDPLFWFVAAFWLAVGAFLVHVLELSGNTFNAWGALSVGLGAPATLKQAGSAFRPKRKPRLG